jgi:dihydrofolate reductase
LGELSESYYAPLEVFVIGGAEIYRQLLPRCTELYLSVVQQVVEGDAFFPAFEDRWELIDIPLRHAEFEVRHYRNLYV